MNIELRPMEVNDAIRVNELSRQLGYTATVTETAERIRHVSTQPQNMIMVALSEDNIVGWMHVFKTTRLEAGSYAEIAAMVIDEHYRGLKIGARLVDAAKKWSLMQSINRIVVSSNVLRDGAHRFYNACGFIAVKEQKIFELSI